MRERNRDVVRKFQHHLIPSNIYLESVAEDHGEVTLAGCDHLVIIGGSNKAEIASWHVD